MFRVQIYEIIFYGIEIGAELKINGYFCKVIIVLQKI